MLDCSCQFRDKVMERNLQVFKFLYFFHFVSPYVLDHDADYCFIKSEAWLAAVTSFFLSLLEFHGDQVHKGIVCIIWLLCLHVYTYWETLLLKSKYWQIS